MTQHTALIKLPFFPYWLETKPQKTRELARAYALQILEDIKIKVVKE